MAWFRCGKCRVGIRLVGGLIPDVLQCQKCGHCFPTDGAQDAGLARLEAEGFDPDGHGLLGMGCPVYTHTADSSYSFGTPSSDPSLEFEAFDAAPVWCKAVTIVGALALMIFWVVTGIIEEGFGPAVLFVGFVGMLVGAIPGLILCCMMVYPFRMFRLTAGVLVLSIAMTTGLLTWPYMLGLAVGIVLFFGIVESCVDARCIRTSSSIVTWGLVLIAAAGVRYTEWSQQKSDASAIETAGGQVTWAAYPYSIKLTDAAEVNKVLPNVLRMGSVTRVDVSESDIDDETLAQLCALPCLKFLDLSNTAVSDEAVRHLVECSRLKGIRIDGTGLSKTGIARMALALPNLAIWRDAESDDYADVFRQGRSVEN